MVLKFKYLYFLLGFVCTTSCAQKKKEILPKTYVAYKTHETIIIDGKENENIWKKTKWTHDFIDIEGKKIPKYKTNIKMLWDENYYYILAKMEEPHVWANLKKRDTIIFYNNDFEVFIDPDGDSHNYYELEINALNTVWDLFITKPYRELENPVLNDWNFTGLKSAITIQGTLNNPSDSDTGWTLEIAIPFKDLRTAYRQDNVPRDQFWRVNFSRVNWQHSIIDRKYARKKDKNNKLLHEYNWVWSAQGVINMHQPETWGYVYFSSKELGIKDSFSIPVDEKIKWKLFELYRKQKAYFSRNKKWQTSLDKIGGGEIRIDNEVLKPVIENHSQGWNIIVKSPYTGEQIIIREDGKILTKSNQL